MKRNTKNNTTCEKYKKSTNYEKFSEFLVCGEKFVKPSRFWPILENRKKLNTDDICNKIWKKINKTISKNKHERKSIFRRGLSCTVEIRAIRKSHGSGTVGPEMVSKMQGSHSNPYE